MKALPAKYEKVLSDRKKMYYLLTKQLGHVLPRYDNTTKRFMWQGFMGLKRLLVKDSKDKSGLFCKEHNPGCQIQENTIKYWVDHLEHFPGWSHYIPEIYVEKIQDT